MRVIAFKANTAGRYHIGRLNDDESITDLTELTGKPDLTPFEINECIDMDGSVWSSMLTFSGGQTLSRESIELTSPVPRPGKVICIGLNYRDHAEESGMAIPTSPIVFSKYSSCIVGKGAPIILPSMSTQVDYEAELAVVIGRRARNVSATDAYNYVLGYCNLNDVSARDLQFADGQWQRGKSCESFAPMGEFIATNDEIADPENLRIRFRLNGETLQDSSTKELIFGIPALIEFLSKHNTLEPGDVIATGTPPGVGFARKPPIFLKDGDICEVEIDGLGILTNPVISGDVNV